MSGTGKLDAQGQTVDVELTRSLVLPDKMRIDIKIGKQFEIAFALDGTKGGWTKGPGGVDDLPAAQVPELERQRWVDPELMLLRHRGPGAKVARCRGEARRQGGRRGAGQLGRRSSAPSCTSIRRPRC